MQAESKCWSQPARRYTPTLMSRGYGQTQRGILDVVEREERGVSGRPQWLAIEDVSLHLYETDKPTPAQRESIRRAAHRLADNDKVELRLGYVGGDREKTDEWPPGVQSWCTQSLWDQCDGCDAGLDAVDTLDWSAPLKSKKPGHTWPDGRVVTRTVRWGTSALLIRYPLTEEERQAERSEREKHAAATRLLNAVFSESPPLPD